MRIVIDMQGAQTKSRMRGIGRYVLSFAEAVCRNRGKHEVILVLNGLFPESIEPIRALFETLLPQDNILVWHAPGPVMAKDPENDSRRSVAELVRESFISSLDPDVIHIGSLFEGYLDDAVTSIGQLDLATPVSVIFYDLIPLLNPEQYLAPNPQYASYYERKIKYLKRASSFLAISEFARQECLANLPLPDLAVVNISTAIRDEFKPIQVAQPDADALMEKFGLTHPFVMYTGGADDRKNLPRLIKAFAALPDHLRNSHQLLFAGDMGKEAIKSFRQIATSCNLEPHSLCFTGYISDEELLQLYNLCKLFAFPSWHEGFGLPALEAMACGTPIIGANTTSLPEVIGLTEALFDPLEINSITTKLSEGLSDESFRNRVRTHGLQQSQKFSWDSTALRAISAWEKLPPRTRPSYADQSLANQKLIQKIAGKISKSNDEYLLELSACITRNQQAGILRQIFVDVSELCQRDSATGVQRVVRSYLKCLLNNPPPDFRIEPVYATATEGYRYARKFTQKFIGDSHTNLTDDPIFWQRGDVFFGLDMQHEVQIKHNSFYRNLQRDGVTVKFLVHDLLPIQLPDYFSDTNAKRLHEQWLTMIASADEAICVSRATLDAYKDWLFKQNLEASKNLNFQWVHSGADIESSNPSAGFPADAQSLLYELSARTSFLCVATLEPRKAQEQVLDAIEVLWNKGIDANLVLVGHKGWKVENLIEKICYHPEHGKRLFWLEGISDEYLAEIYKASTCLISASINEGFGLPLIEAARYGIPIVARDIPVFREVAGNHAFYFSGESANDLSNALEIWLERHKQGNALPSSNLPWSTWKDSSDKLKSILVKTNYRKKQILIDVSELARRDARTGIQRVVRNILKEWLSAPPLGYWVEPVYATEGKDYRYARKFTHLFQNRSGCIPSDAPIEFAPGDIFFALDLQPKVQISHKRTYEEMRRNGVSVLFAVYDLLSIQLPQYFIPGSDKTFKRWLDVVSESDGAICISKSVSNELQNYLNNKELKRIRSFKNAWFHLGADPDKSQDSKGLPIDIDKTLSKLMARRSFLMVGTLEPRKGHEQVIEAFELLWNHGIDINLVIVGKQGWMVESLSSRLRSHPENRNRLLWLEGISDEFLEKVYSNSTCIIAASYGEGFGLPLIEAAQHRLPIMARDLPVFREVSGNSAWYFKCDTPEELSISVTTWLDLFERGRHPKSDSMPWLSWKGSALELAKLVFPNANNMTRDTQMENTDANCSTPTNGLSFPPSPALPLPSNITEAQLLKFVTSVRVQDAPEAEMRAYGTHDFRRFVYTLGLAQKLSGKCLELGGNPYFTTMLLKEFTELDVQIANYFGHEARGEFSQNVDYCDFNTGVKCTKEFKYQHFNIENDSFPYEDNEFDLVIFAEIIEHLLNDPCKVLREIKRILKPAGTLILTTPNVARLENVVSLMNGTNIYDPYSGYGPYGRHNREYTRHELEQLLKFEGFDPSICFTADVHANNAQALCDVVKLATLLQHNENDRGQYIFISAIAKDGAWDEKRPRWLYRSYEDGALI